MKTWKPFIDAPVETPIKIYTYNRYDNGITISKGMILCNFQPFNYQFEIVLYEDYMTDDKKPIEKCRFAYNYSTIKYIAGWNDLDEKDKCYEYDDYYGKNAQIPLDEENKNYDYDNFLVKKV